MPSIKDALSGVRSTTSMVLEAQLNRLFATDRANQEVRTGMHGSGIIVGDAEFCYRKQVLSFFYVRDNVEIPVKLQRIFLEGWHVHEKWQKLFKQAGIDRGIEQRGHSKDMSLLFTPDAVIELKGRLWVVEIKSMNEFAFRRANGHPSGEKQLMLYMHMLAIPRGFVLCENKNSQDIRVFEKRYDPEVASPFVERMINVREYVGEFAVARKRSVLPERTCTGSTCKRAMGCDYRTACYNLEGLERL